jgi:hypothetical protein
MRWRRVRRLARWALTALTAAAIVAWPLGRWWIVGIGLPGERDVALHSGCLWFSIDAPPPVPELGHLLGPYVLENGMGRELGLSWHFVHMKNKLAEFVSVPLWAVVPLLATATGLA